MLLMIAYVYGLLNRFKRFRQLKPFVSAEPMKRLIRKRTLIFVDFLLSSDTRIGLIDIMNRKIYLTMLLVFILSTFIMIIPALVYHTTSSEEFIENIGFSHKVDIATSLYQSTNSIENQEKIEAYLSNDPDVAAFSKISTKILMCMRLD